MSIASDLLEDLELTEVRAEFKKIDWKAVIKEIGGTLQSIDKKSGDVSFYHFGKKGGFDYVLSDNGGEFNVSKTVPAFNYSIPYDINTGVRSAKELSTDLLDALSKG